MCNQCEVLNINGINCHETGCPDAWRDARPDCKWCGGVVIPESRGDELCGADCIESYYL